MKKIVQAAGRNALGSFAPEFAHYNDGILFDENRNNQDIDHKTCCIITVVALMSSGITDSSLHYHLEDAKKVGVTKAEITAIVTHVTFYIGRPKGWAVFNITKKVWTEDPVTDAKSTHENGMVFPIDALNDAYAQYFVERNYPPPVSTSQVDVFNVTFEPGYRDSWCIHNAAKSGGQILVCVAGCGYYQEQSKDAIETNPGDYINIPVGVRHWHGTAPDSQFSHLVVEVPDENDSNGWLEAADTETCGKLE